MKRHMLLARVAAALSLTTMLLAGVAIERFVLAPSTPDDRSPETGFARAMSVHHDQAVEIGQIAFARSANPTIRAIGYDIALSQQLQIGRMQRWLDEWKLPLTSPRPLMEWMNHSQSGEGPSTMPGMATPQEIQQLRALAGREFDILFCEVMIRHHLGGLHMIEEILQRTDLPDVQPLGASMKVTQLREVASLQELLKQT